MLRLCKNRSRRQNRKSRNLWLEAYLQLRSWPCWFVLEMILSHDDKRFVHFSTLGTISSVGVAYLTLLWTCTRGDLGGGCRGLGLLAISGVWEEKVVVVTSSWESELFSLSSFSTVIRRRICLKFLTSICVSHSTFKD